MMKPNWNQFKAKFNEDPQSSFEWFCYLLFCKEFDQPKGIFRYFNQSGMETNPVQVGDDWIAWEAKFYEDKLSDYKDNFKKKLEIINSKNPEVNKVIFYTPIDWTESRKKTKRKTKAQDEIESKAKEVQINIEWRGGSYFEKICSDEDNEMICQYFFVSEIDRSIIDLLEEKKVHTERIMDGIQSHIDFDSQTIVYIDPHKSGTVKKCRV